MLVRSPIGWVAWRSCNPPRSCCLTAIGYESGRQQPKREAWRAKPPQTPPPHKLQPDLV